jgi:hypothetical protein
MKASVIIAAVASTLAVVYGYNENPVVQSPKNMTYNAGMKIPITWKEATTGHVNIDLVNMYRNVLDTPYSIAFGVPAAEGKYMWEVPADLKTAVGYQVRVWGSFQPKSIDSYGNSALFTVFNDLPQAVNNFKVTSPSKANPCRIDGPCKITWDFPKTINPPADVDVVLYKIGDPLPVAKLATVKASDKEYVWNVPADMNLLELGPVFISVDGSGVAHEAPKMASNMGANSEAFKVEKQLPPPPRDEKAEAEAAAKAKEEAEKAEAEKKAKEEEEQKAADELEKKREEELKKRQQALNKKNAAASGQQVAAAVVVLSAMVAALPFF